MILKNASFFQEKENLTGKKETILIIDCKKCLEKEENITGNKQCLNCLFYNLYFYKDKKFDSISILSSDQLIQYRQFEPILEYYKKLKKINTIIKKFLNIRNVKCNFEEFKCENFQSFSKVNRIREFEYYDPIFIYKILLKVNSDFRKKVLKNPICRKCQNYIEDLLESLLKIFNNLELIKGYNKFNNKNGNFYDFLLASSSILAKKTQENRKLSEIENNKLLATYNIGGYENFQVWIHQIPYENEKLYSVKIILEEDEEEDYFNRIINDIILNVKVPEFERIIPLEKLIDLYKKESISLLKSKYRLSEPTLEKYGFIAALKKLFLYKIFPLLLDDHIEEIFLDSPDDEIYLNHQTFGRCRTIIRFSSKEIERFKTLFRLYSGKRLDYMNPSIKLVIKNHYFNCRFAVDTEPIQIDTFALDIRKLNKNIFTIQDLLKNDTLDPKIAAFLYFVLLRRRNITITGETDTGKTTLINTLDLLTPKELRKIYIENVTESLKQSDSGNHQLKYRVDSLEEPPFRKYSKSNIIKTLLHRSPDIIYLGEILTKEEAEAMFHCLAAGLKGFQTIHSNNINSLINRFLYHFNINESCLSDLDLLILMKKEFNKRRIFSISEIKKNTSKGNSFCSIIFKYDPLSKDWKLLKSLYETEVLTEIIEYENLSKEKFTSFMKVYNEIFEFISSIKRLDNTKLINLFHRISYYSFISIESLNQFWNNWKNKRALKH
ncbi:MAG: ATPase, T2SS/T4P/T4SS family [Candidatus Hodarchaeota archaeon]